MGSCLYYITTPVFSRHAGNVLHGLLESRGGGCLMRFNAHGPAWREPTHQVTNGVAASRARSGELQRPVTVVLR